MRYLVAFLTCLIGVSLVGQDCEFNSINIEVVGSDAEIGWSITQYNGWALVSGALDSYENICLEDGCYPFNMYDGNGDGWIETTITIFYTLTNEVIFSGTLEYGNVESLNIQIGDSFECSFACTDPTACNFNPLVDTDDGSCEYTSCACIGDINGDGTITVADLLIVLSDFGCTSDCMADVDGDGFVTVADLLALLAAYGETCENQGFQDCGDLISHEGYDYSTVLIGEQCWFSENCRYLPSVSPSSASSTTEPYYYVYGYEGTDVASAMSTSNYATYGVLYNWPAVMTEGICPSGWHIPSDGEFTELSDFLGGEDVAGGKMKEAGYDHWYSPNEGATNSSGWTGLPGGARYSGGFLNNGYYGYWWSASESGSYSWIRELNYNYDNVYRNYGTSRSNGFSARCVRDD